MMLCLRLPCFTAVSRIHVLANNDEILYKPGVLKWWPTNPKTLSLALKMPFPWPSKCLWMHIKYRNKYGPQNDYKCTVSIAKIRCIWPPWDIWNTYGPLWWPASKNNSKWEFWSINWMKSSCKILSSATKFVIPFCRRLILKIHYSYCIPKPIFV